MQGLKSHFLSLNQILIDGSFLCWAQILISVARTDRGTFPISEDRYFFCDCYTGVVVFSVQIKRTPGGPLPFPENV